MEKYFCNYNQSLALKELGFNIPVNTSWVINKMYPQGIIGFGSWINHNSYNDHLSAPLKSQVFEFFREKHGLWFRPDFYDEMKTYDYQGSIHKLGRFSSIASLDNHKTVEELESACIDKLIEIIKSK